MPLADYSATYTGGSALIDQVRRAIMDVDTDTTPPEEATAREDWSVLFVDSEILAVAANYPLNTADYTAADLLDFIASNSALLAKRITLGEYTEDTRATAKALHEQADALRHKADSIPFEMITDYPYTDSNWGRMVIRPGQTEG